jgi:hypothetical protein
MGRALRRSRPWALFEEDDREMKPTTTDQARIAANRCAKEDKVESSRVRGKARESDLVRTNQSSRRRRKRSSLLRVSERPLRRGPRRLKNSGLMTLQLN